MRRELTTLEIFDKINVELNRFNERFNRAYKLVKLDPKNYHYNCNQEHAACKRSAIDLKMELNKLTTQTKNFKQ